MVPHPVVIYTPKEAPSRIFVTGGSVIAWQMLAIFFLFLARRACSTSMLVEVDTTIYKNERGEDYIYTCIWYVAPRAHTKVAYMNFSLWIRSNCSTKNRGAPTCTPPGLCPAPRRSPRGLPGAPPQTPPKRSKYRSTRGPWPCAEPFDVLDV